MELTPTTPRIAFRTEGDSGPRVLFIMGFGMSGVLWKPQVEALRATHRVAYYDHLGIGASDPPDRPVSMPSMAHDAVRVLDALGWPDAHVVGVSMGGMIAQELTLHAQARVSSLTLIATHAGGWGAVLPKPRGLAHFVAAQTGDPAARIRALKRLLYTDAFLARADERLDQRIAEMTVRRAPRSVLLGHLRAVLGHRTRHRLGWIRVPTLIVRPDQDILIHPRNSDVLADELPHARLVRFDDAGHGLTFEAATSLNDEIMRHIAAAEASRAARTTPARDLSVAPT